MNHDSDFLDRYDNIDFDPLEEYSFLGVNTGESIATEEVEDMPSVFAEGPYNFPNPDAVPQFQRDLVSFENGETARERIDALFAQMPTFQKFLYSIVSECLSPISTDNLESHINQTMRNHQSVYEALTFVDLLKRAGAIEQTDEEGTPLEEFVQEPLEIDIDGVQYWRVAPAPVVYWCTTEDGRKKIDEYKPLEKIANLYKEEPEYAEIFTTCLKMCAQGDGCEMREIGNVVDDEPVLQNPKRFAMYFIDKLEHAGAVEWTNKWSITNYGREFLQNMGNE